MAKPVRRVITGLNSSGRSCVISDETATVTLGDDTTPVFSSELWKTRESPAETTAESPAGHDAEGWRDPVQAPIVNSPPPTGSIFRVVEFPPQKTLTPEQWAAWFEAIGQPLQEDEDPSMHATDTIDYTVILEGEIWAKLEEGEVVLKPGDTIVQRGVAHAWENRGDVPCRFVAVSIGAQPRPHA